MCHEGTNGSLAFVPQKPSTVPCTFAIQAIQHQADTALRCTQSCTQCISQWSTTLVELQPGTSELLSVTKLHVRTCSSQILSDLPLPLLPEQLHELPSVNVVCLVCLVCLS